MASRRWRNTLNGTVLCVACSLIETKESERCYVAHLLRMVKFTDAFHECAARVVDKNIDRTKRSSVFSLSITWQSQHTITGTTGTATALLCFAFAIREYFLILILSRNCLAEGAR